METTTEELLIGYALGTLDAAEQQTAESYIARNPAARDVVLEWQSLAHHVAFTAPVVRPAPRVKQQLMERVKASKQPVRPAARPAKRLSVAWGVMLAICVLLGGWNIALRSENAKLQADNQTLAQSLDNERTQRVRLTDRVTDADAAIKLMAAQSRTSRDLFATTNAPNAKGTMYMQPGNTTALLVVDGLAPLPKDRVYQFWLARDGQAPIPSDTFSVGADGHAEIVIQADAQVNDFKQVMVTIEPVAGSTTPGATVLEGNL